MTNKRVEFKLKGTFVNHTMVKLVKNVFGKVIPRNMGDVYIICTPAQFARFLIFRNKAGMSNGFKELSPVLFNLKPSPDVPKLKYDVSDNVNIMDVPYREIEGYDV